MESCQKKGLMIRKAEKYQHMEVTKKQKLSTQNAEKYRLMKLNKKQELSVQNAEKHKFMEANKKQQLRVQNAERYRLMEPNKKQKLFLQNADKYRITDSVEKKDLIKQIVNIRKELKEKKCLSTHSLDYYIQQSNRAINLLWFIVCNRLLYRKIVLRFKKTVITPVPVCLQVLRHLTEICTFVILATRQSRRKTKLRIKQCTTILLLMMCHLSLQV